MQIETAFGKRTVVRRVGAQGEYAETLPTPSAPHGEWWTQNPQRGWVPVPSNGRALLSAIEREHAKGAPSCGACKTQHSPDKWCPEPGAY